MVFRKKKRVLSEDEKKYLLLEKKITSREYKIFREHENKGLSWYESSANLSAKALKVRPSKTAAKKLQSAITFTGLRITPTGVYSSALLAVVISVFLGIGLMIMTGLSFTLPLLVVIAGVGFGYYLLKYPENQVKMMRVKASSQVVLAILYMVVSMRMSPNLERALKFAAGNISGELAWDMRRLVWDIMMRKYNSAEEALSDYIVKWKPENEEFSEALRLIRDSQYQTPARAESTLDEALEVILEGTKTRMKYYTQDLRLPVMVIHMMGIILPVLGTIMAPMAAVFLGDVLRPEYFFVGYDIALPLFILWFINNTLKKRPVTISEIDITDAPGIPPKGTFLIGGRKGARTAIPALPIALLIGLAFLLLPIFYFSQTPEMLLPVEGAVTKGAQFPVEALFMSILITVGVGIALASYFILTNMQSVKKQAEIEATEGQLELALFSLGNRIGAGVPVELALEKAIPDIKDKEIADLYKIAVRNIKVGGMTLEDAFFDKKYGAVRKYPSKLIRNIVYAVVDTAKKGVGYTSESMMTISKYMKNVRETQDYIREILSDTTSSMKFQAYMLTPIITGLIVSMSQIIVQVLSTLGQRLASSGLGGGTGPLGGVGTNLFGDVDKAIPPAIFQLIVGIYLIEVIVILAIFLTKISHGENKVVQWMSAGRMLIIGLVMYAIVALISSTLFVGLIGNALKSFTS